MKQRLTEGEVHLHLLDHEAVVDLDRLARCERLLSEAERARRDRFAFAAGRHQQLVARALVRTTLSRYAEVEPEAWAFRENRWGRPELEGPRVSPPLTFNLSHTHGQMVLLVASGREAGVDVEDTERITRPEEIAERYFSASEVAELFSQPQARRRDRFFDYWTLKESYIKARGMGLFIPLEHFAFDLSGGEVRISFDSRLPDDPHSWRFSVFQPTPRHRLAIALRVRAGEQAPPLAVFHTVPFESPETVPLAARCLN